MKFSILLLSLLLCFALSDAFVRRRSKLQKTNGSNSRSPAPHGRLSSAASQDNYQLVPKHYGHIVIKPVRQRRKRLFRYFGSPPILPPHSRSPQPYQSHPKVTQNFHHPEVVLHHGESQRGVVFHPPPQPTTAVLFNGAPHVLQSGHQRVVFRPLFSPQLGSPGSWKPLVRITETVDPLLHFPLGLPRHPPGLDASFHPESGLTKETLFRANVDGGKVALPPPVVDNSISQQSFPEGPGVAASTISPPTVSPTVFLSPPPSPSAPTPTSETIQSQDIRFGRTAYNSLSPSISTGQQGKGGQYHHHVYSGVDSQLSIQPSLEVYNGHTVNEFSLPAYYTSDFGVDPTRQPLFQRPSVEVHSGQSVSTINADPYGHLPRLNTGELSHGSADTTSRISVQVTTAGHPRPTAASDVVKPSVENKGVAQTSTEPSFRREPLVDPYGGLGVNAINSDYFSGFPGEQQLHQAGQYQGLVPGSIDYAGELQRAPGSPPVHYVTVFRPVANEPILHPGRHPQQIAQLVPPSIPFSHVYNIYGQGPVPNQFLGQPSGGVYRVHPGYDGQQRFSVVPPNVPVTEPIQSAAVGLPVGAPGAQYSDVPQVIGINNLGYAQPNLVGGVDPRLFVGGTSYIAYAIPNTTLNYVPPPQQDGVNYAGNAEQGAEEAAGKNSTESASEPSREVHTGEDVGGEHRASESQTTVPYPILSTGAEKGVTAEVVYKSSAGVEYNVNQVHPTSVPASYKQAEVSAGGYSTGYGSVGGAPQYVDIRYILGNLGDVSPGPQDTRSQGEQYDSSDKDVKSSDAEKTTDNSYESGGQGGAENSPKRGTESADDIIPYSHSYFTGTTSNGQR